MPNCTLPYLYSLTPRELDGVPIETHAIDEYVHTDLRYLDLFESTPERPTIVAIVGVQSHQFHRALDLGALAKERGALAVMGGPHPMTCDTSQMHGRGVSFALSEAERIWEQIMRDAIQDRALKPVYGGDARWTPELNPPVLKPPSKRDLGRYSARLLGIYPARGCPYRCSFCSIIKIAGHQVRSQPVETTLASLRAAKKAGAGAVFFTSDNFNKYPDGPTLLQAMIDEKLEMPFIAQCDLQVYDQQKLVELMGRAGCIQMFLGVESFDRAALLGVSKQQNHPSRYQDVRRLCSENGVSTLFANILGFMNDTPEKIDEHLDVLKSFGSELASFYILTPLPGTEQYDEFMRDGLIDETNLDRFDASCLTFRHPSFTREQLTAQIYRAYREFYSIPQFLKKGLRALKRAPSFARRAVAFNVIAFGLVSRWASMGRISGRREPTLDFAGGLGRRRVDHVSEYLPRRKATYGFEFAPLPKSLELSAGDKALNRSAKLVVHQPEARSA